MRDLANHISVRHAIAPAAAKNGNDPIVGEIIDLSGFSQAMFAVLIGAVATAGAAFAVSIQHGDEADLSDAEEVPAHALTGTLDEAGFTGANDGETRKIGYVGPRQYVRLTLTPTGNAGDAFVSAVAVLGTPRYWPAA